MASGLSFLSLGEERCGCGTGLCSRESWGSGSGGGGGGAVRPSSLLGHATFLITLIHISCFSVFLCLSLSPCPLFMVTFFVKLLCCSCLLRIY